MNDHKLEEMFATQKQMLIEELTNFIKYWQGQFGEGEAVICNYYNGNIDADIKFNIQDKNIIDTLINTIRVEDIKMLRKNELWIWESLDVLEKANDYTPTAKFKFKDYL